MFFELLENIPSANEKEGQGGEKFDHFIEENGHLWKLLWD